MRVAVRLDDITPDMDWAKFNEVKRMLDAAGICPLVGIVPDNRDPNLHCEEAHPDFWEYFAKLRSEGWTVAQHGYQHVYATNAGGLFPLNKFSEFAGLSYEKQLEMIRMGQEILASHKMGTDVFMTPAHSYDMNTLHALRECGFKYVTDGFGKYPYIREGITFLPIPFRMADSLKERDGYTTMVLHVNTMNEGDMARLRERLDNFSERVFSAGDTKNCFINYSEMLSVKSVNRRHIDNVNEFIMATIKRGLVSMKK